MNMMEIQMEIPHIINQADLKEDLNAQKIYKQIPYRWVIVSLMGFSLLINGLANNAVIPLEHKMTVIYGVSPSKVSVSVILSFLVFSIVNFPANHIIDSKGLRISFLIGTGLFTIGIFFYVLINYSYYFVILGTFFIGAGQPFLLNCPAKVAAFWFSPKNRAFSTSIMVGINLLGMGIGFLVPTLAVNEQSTGQIAKRQMFHLYLAYFLVSAACLVLNYIFMRSKPQISPSQSADAQKLSSPIESFKHLRKDMNLWKFFIAYFFIYGTFLAFASNCNFIIKTYGYTDIQIAVNAVMLMIIGTIGAIVFSLYIKKTSNYKTTTRIIAIGSPVMLIILCGWLNLVNVKFLTTLIISVMGFLLTPVVPLSYDLGCELAFPMGEAQVTGLLNGGAMLWAFLSSSLITAVVGFGTQHKSLIVMAILTVFIIIGSVLFFLVKIDLKRQKYQKQNQTNQKVNQNSDSPQKKVQQLTDCGKDIKNYQVLIEQKASDSKEPPYL